MGYFFDYIFWEEGMVEIFVCEENIELIDVYWEVICFVCGFYEEYEISLVICVLVKVMVNKYGFEKGNSCYL